MQTLVEMIFRDIFEMSRPNKAILHFYHYLTKMNTGQSSMATYGESKEHQKNVECRRKQQ